MSFKLNWVVCSRRRLLNVSSRYPQSPLTKYTLYHHPALCVHGYSYSVTMTTVTPGISFICFSVLLCIVFITPLWPMCSQHLSHVTWLANKSSVVDWNNGLRPQISVWFILTPATADIRLKPAKAEKKQ